MTDINSHVELLAPSRRPGTTKPTGWGDTPVAVGEFKVNGIIGLWFCLKHRSWGESTVWLEQLIPRRDQEKMGCSPTDAALEAKKLEERKKENTFCSQKLHLLLSPTVVKQEPAEILN